MNDKPVEPKQPYTAPKLVTFGTIAQLTLGTTSLGTHGGCPSELVVTALLPGWECEPR